MVEKARYTDTWNGLEDMELSIPEERRADEGIKSLTKKDVLKDQEQTTDQGGWEGTWAVVKKTTSSSKEALSQGLALRW